MNRTLGTTFCSQTKLPKMGHFGCFGHFGSFEPFLAILVRYSAEKTHHFRRAGASRISNVILKGTIWELLKDYLETTWRLLGDNFVKVTLRLLGAYLVPPLVQTRCYTSISDVFFFCWNILVSARYEVGKHFWRLQRYRLFRGGWKTFPFLLTKSPEQDRVNIDMLLPLISIFFY